MERNRGEYRAVYEDDALTEQWFDCNELLHNPLGFALIEYRKNGLKKYGGRFSHGHHRNNPPTFWENVKDSALWAKTIKKLIDYEMPL